MVVLVSTDEKDGVAVVEPEFESKEWFEKRFSEIQEEADLNRNNLELLVPIINEGVELVNRYKKLHDLSFFERAKLKAFVNLAKPLRKLHKMKK